MFVVIANMANVSIYLTYTYFLGIFTAFSTTTTTSRTTSGTQGRGVTAANPISKSSVLFSPNNFSSYVNHIISLLSAYKNIYFFKYLYDV